MPEPDSNEVPPTSKPASSASHRIPRDDTMDEEEKVLAGRIDANIPALLTKDVPGG